MSKLDIEKTPGTPKEPVMNWLSPPYYKTVSTPVRCQFSYHSDRVELQGEADSLQDLSNVLREMLAEIELQLSARARDTN